MCWVKLNTCGLTRQHRIHKLYTDLWHRKSQSQDDEHQARVKKQRSSLIHMEREVGGDRDEVNRFQRSHLGRVDDGVRRGW